MIEPKKIGELEKIEMEIKELRQRIKEKHHVIKWGITDMEYYSYIEKI